MRLCIWSLILTVVKSRREQNVWVCTSHVTACLFTPNSHNRRLHLKWLWWGVEDCVCTTYNLCAVPLQMEADTALCSVCIHTQDGFFTSHFKSYVPSGSTSQCTPGLCHGWQCSSECRVLWMNAPILQSVSVTWGSAEKLWVLVVRRNGGGR